MATVEARLDNGLKVILKEAHAAPVISTWLWYRVGSRNEVEGCTGISHWVEHMMFKGSRGYPKGSIMRLVDRNGGYVNAMTSHDFTAYYMTLPAEHARIALEVEADRMSGALFDAAETESERTVVIAEREGSENEPRFVLAEEMTAAAFRVHAYHHQTIGWKEDLEHITRDDLYAHYRGHYVPNNASLVVVGDLNCDEYLAQINECFGSIPAGEVPARHVLSEPPQRGERRVVVRMPGNVPMVRISYHVPPVSHSDYIPLVVLDALLSGGKAMFAFSQSQARSARLYRALVESELASSVGSSYHPSLDPYLMTLSATVRQGHSPEQVEDALIGAVSRLQTETVSGDELAVAVRQTQAQFAYSSESVTSQALTLGFLDMVDDHQRMDRVLDEISAVTAEDVQRVASTYLNRDNSVIGRFEPTGDAAGNGSGNGNGHGNGSAGDGNTQSFWRPPEFCGLTGHAGAARRPAVSAETIIRHVMSNGAVLLIKENPTSATVSVEGQMTAGGCFDTPDTAGLASLTAAMSRRGTTTHTFQELNQILDNVGASASLAAGRDDMGFGGKALAADCDLLIDVLAEMLMQPAFDSEELRKYKGQLLTHLDVLATDTGYRSDRAFMQMLYSADHPYHRPPIGTPETVTGLDRDDLVEYHARYYQPANMLVSVAGAVDARHIIDKLEATLGRWRREYPAAEREIVPAATPQGIQREQVNIPAKAQVDMIWGVIGMPRTSDDYYPAMMANVILGRLGLMGRLGDQVRDVQGLAYYVSSGLRGGPGYYPWNVVAGVHPKDVDRALDSILEQVARMRQELVSDEEIGDCRSYLQGALPLHLETNEGIADFMLTIEEYGLGLDYLTRYPEILAGVQREDLRRVVEQYMTLDSYVLAMAGTFG